MAEQLLYCTDVVAVFEEMGGKEVVEGVAGGALDNVSFADNALDGFLDIAFVDMVAANDVAARVLRELDGWKEILPIPFTLIS